MYRKGVNTSHYNVYVTCIVLHSIFMFLRPLHNTETGCILNTCQWCVNIYPAYSLFTVDIIQYFRLTFYKYHACSILGKKDIQ